jgi:hypothetical protein
MVEFHSFRDDVFVLWPTCGLWLRKRRRIRADSVLIGWGYWGIEIRLTEGRMK